MKKIVSVILAVLMILSTFPLNILAIDDNNSDNEVVGLNLLLNKTSVSIGEEVLITVSIFENTGIASMCFDINYDCDAFELKESSAKIVPNYKSNLEIANTEIPGTARFNWIYDGALNLQDPQNYTSTGAFAQIVLVVKENVTLGDYDITLVPDVENIFRTDDKNIAVIGDMTKTITIVSNEEEKPETYTIFYDANGGTGAPVNQIKEKGENLILSETVPAKDGWVFVCWDAYFKDSSFYPFLPGETVYNDGDITLIARWRKVGESYALRYYAEIEGAKNVPEPQNKIYGVPITLSTKVPECIGKIFEGWIPVSLNGDKYQPGDSYNDDRIQVLEALFRDVETYNVSYDANGGEGAPNVQIKTQTLDLTLSNIVPTRSGFDFLYWQDSDGTTYEPGSKYIKDIATVLTAVWKVKTYAVSYNANTGIGAPDIQEKEINKELTISKTVPTKDGFVFVCWDTVLNGKEYSLLPGDTIPSDINEDIVLTAHWERAGESYAFNYIVDLVGATNIPEQQTKIYGVPITISNKVPECIGWVFEKWIQLSPLEKGYQPGDSYNDDRIRALKAVFYQVDTYAIVFDANSGINAPETQIKNQGVPLKLSTEKPSKENWVFLYWYDDYGTYYPGDNYLGDRDTVLKAYWVPNWTPTIYVANVSGFPGETIEIPVYIKDNLEIKNEIFDIEISTSVEAKKGEWYFTNNDEIQEDGFLGNLMFTIPLDAQVGKEYTVGALVNSFKVDYFDFGDTINIVDGKITVVNCVVSYDAGNGVGAPEEQIKKYGVPLTLSNTVPTRSGYKFEYWQADDGTVYVPGSEYTKELATTLSAVWIEKNPDALGTMSVSSGMLVKGGSKKVSVNVSENVGATVIQFTLNYDATKLVLKRAAVGSAMGEKGPTININSPGQIIFAWDALDQLNEGGSLIDLIFEAKDDAEGITLISVDNVKGFVFAGDDYVRIPLNFETGVISICDAVKGDANCDGEINVVDANIVRRCAAKLVTFNEIQEEVADVNMDGDINVIDANLIRKYAAKLISNFPTS